MERQHAVEIFTSAVAAVHPAQLLRQHIAVYQDWLCIGEQNFPKTSIRHIYVTGAGKAAAAMAIETEKILGAYITDGLVTTKYHHALPSVKTKIIEAAHPVPDENCVKAVTQTLQLLKKAGKQDIVICLISGGASALWCDVPHGTTLKEVQTVFNLLIQSGAAIEEVNTVRKHLSAIKGGQLIRHCGGATVISFIISDVPADNLGVIASGPTVADASTFRDAYAILEKWKLLPVLPQSIRLHMEEGIKGTIEETPKAGDALFYNTFNKIIGSNQMAVQAAAAAAKALGYHVHITGHVIKGDAATEAEKLVTLASAYNGKKPACLLQGGETTVHVTGSGKGGRNLHFALMALHGLNKLQHKSSFNEITILSGGTDGTDGPTDAAGAIVGQETLMEALRLGLSIEGYLKEQDAYHFFKQTNSLLITGPTQTNVMDIMMAIVK